jgi:hypothetical protein
VGEWRSGGSKKILAGYGVVGKTATITTPCLNKQSWV